MDWIYLPDKSKLKDGQLYLTCQRTIDLYISGVWVLQHPGDRYDAVIPISESDIEWFECIPPEYGLYVVKRQGLETIWVDSYGPQPFDGGRIGWLNDIVPTLKWGKIPFIDKIDFDECKILFSPDK